MGKPGNKKWQEDRISFVNPYNFVPYNKTVERTPVKDGALSGKIRCTLTAVTPLAIPDHEKKVLVEGSTDHYKYSFFTNGKGIHTIPGSSIRGVVRSMFETLTNSCFSVNNNNILSMRHSFQRTPGLLIFENGRWHLYNAKKTKFHGGANVRSDQAVRVWYDIGRKYHTKFLFTKEYEVDCYKLDKAVEDYNECVDIYSKNAEKSNDHECQLFKESTKGLDKNALNPVFYELVDKHTDKGVIKTVYLSPAQMSRSVFHNKLDDLLDDHKACRKIENDEQLLCEGCALFGTLGNKKAYAGRVRFTDANEVSFLSAGYHTLKELASPKTTSVEFYTYRPDNAKVWNYDYKTVKYEKIKQKNGRKMDIPKREISDIRIRGRKFYLHSSDSNYETEERTKRNSTMELADIGSSFTFDVYFDNIDEQQLSKLVWTLALGDNAHDSFKCYKIGHGKPLGLGSAKIVVDEVTVRSYDADKMLYKTQPESIDDLIGNCEIKTNKSIDRIIDTSTTKGMKVSYPIAQDKTVKNANSKAAHQWFVANRTINGTGTAWDIDHSLPLMTDKSIELPAYERISIDSSNNNPPPVQSFGGNVFGSIQIKTRGNKNKKDKNKR